MREEKAAESHRKVKVKPASDESDWVEGGHSAAVGGGRASKELISQSARVASTRALRLTNACTFLRGYHPEFKS